MPHAIALSIRQPWAWLILHAGKDVENRTWPSKFRGRFLIHASRGATWNEYSAARAWVRREVSAEIKIPSLADLPRGGFVGSVEIIGCENAREGLPTNSPWFEGPWGFILRDPRPMSLIQCPGRLGFFPSGIEDPT